MLLFIIVVVIIIFNIIVIIIIIIIIMDVFYPRNVIGRASSLSVAAFVFAIL